MRLRLVGSGSVFQRVMAPPTSGKPPLASDESPSSSAQTLWLRVPESNFDQRILRPPEFMNVHSPGTDLRKSAVNTSSAIIGDQSQPGFPVRLRSSASKKNFSLTAPGTNAAEEPKTSTRFRCVASSSGTSTFDPSLAIACRSTLSAISRGCQRPRGSRSAKKRYTLPDSSFGAPATIQPIPSLTPPGTIDSITLPGDIEPLATETTSSSVVVAR